MAFLFHVGIARRRGVYQTGKEVRDKAGKLNGKVAIRQGGEGAPERGVQTWLEDNRSVVQPWIDAAKEAQQTS